MNFVLPFAGTHLTIYSIGLEVVQHKADEIVIIIDRSRLEIVKDFRFGQRIQIVFQETNLILP